MLTKFHAVMILTLHNIFFTIISPFYNLKKRFVRQSRILCNRSRLIIMLINLDFKH